MRQKQLVAGSIVALIAAASLFLAGWSVREALLAGNGDMSHAVSRLASWSGDAWKVALGAVIAGVTALIVGWMNLSEKQIDRLEGEKARFSDRIRELSAEALAIGRNHVGLCHQYVQGDLKEVPILPERFGQIVQELRLIVRLEVTYDAAQRFFAAVSGFDSLEPGLQWMRAHKKDQAAYASKVDEYTAAGGQLTDAIRGELGRPSIPRTARSD